MIVSGDLETMLRRTKECIDSDKSDQVLIFDDQTGTQIDFDFRGTIDDVIARLGSHPLADSFDFPQIPKSGPGRPRLGVVSREVSMLPRHWEWLENQSGGISATLRKLVEEARKSDNGKTDAKNSRDAVAKFMWVMAGNLPNFEEATRALYAGDNDRLSILIDSWPVDVRDHIKRLLSDGTGE